MVKPKLNLILIFILAIISRSLEACSCPVIIDVDKLIANATTVQLAHVISARVEGKDVIIHLNEIDVVKGVQKNKISTPVQSAACGMPIVVGRDYWLFIGANSVILNCNGTVQLGASESILISRKYLDLIRRRSLR